MFKKQRFFKEIKYIVEITEIALTRGYECDILTKRI